jgi:hypothetical protein
MPNGWPLNQPGQRSDARAARVLRRHSRYGSPGRRTDRKASTEPASGSDYGRPSDDYGKRGQSWHHRSGTCKHARRRYRAGSSRRRSANLKLLDSRRRHRFDSGMTTRSRENLCGSSWQSKPRKPARKPTRWPAWSGTRPCTAVLGNEARNLVRWTDMEKLSSPTSGRRRSARRAALGLGGDI